MTAPDVDALEAARAAATHAHEPECCERCEAGERFHAGATCGGAGCDPLVQCLRCGMPLPNHMPHDADCDAVLPALASGYVPKAALLAAVRERDALRAAASKYERLSLKVTGILQAYGHDAQYEHDAGHTTATELIGNLTDALAAVDGGQR